MQIKRQCFVTGKEYGALDRHHCLHGWRRKKADQYGLWVWLDHDVHMKLHSHCAPYESLDDALKIAAQKVYEEQIGTRDDFIREFGCNYIKEVEP